MFNLFIDTNILITLVSILPILVLGFFVYLRADTSKTYKTVFLLASVFISLWAVANYFSLNTESHTLILWVRAVLFLAIIQQFLFYLLVHVLVTKEDTIKRDIKIITLGILTFVGSISALTPYVFKQINTEGGTAIPVVGPLIPLFAISVVTLFIAGGAEILKKIKTEETEKKMQYVYIAVGYFAMFTLLIFTQFILSAIFQNTSFIQFGPLFVLPFLASIAYAIFKHNLFNIRVIATEIFSALVMFVFFINIFFSSSGPGVIFNLFLFLLITLFGILLVRGTIREINALEELSEKKSEFLSIASHQLRTPVSILKGYLSMLREGSFGKLSEKQLAVISKAYRSNEGMLALINDFLNLSRAEKGTLEYSFLSTDIVEMVDEIVINLKTSAQAKNIEINWKKPEKPLYVEMDENKISQVVSNLIDNAIKYTPNEGGVSVRIAQEDIHNKKVRIYVKDNGIGIDPGEIDSIFESFQRGNRGKRENATGTGLGLYVAKMIVEGHNGRIWAESEGEEEGSTFIVELPLKLPKTKE